MQSDPRPTTPSTDWKLTIEGPDGYRDTETFTVADAKTGRAAARKVMKVATSTFEKTEGGE